MSSSVQFCSVPFRFVSFLSVSFCARLHTCTTPRLVVSAASARLGHSAPFRLSRLSHSLPLVSCAAPLRLSSPLLLHRRSSRFPCECLSDSRSYCLEHFSVLCFLPVRPLSINLSEIQRKFEDMFERNLSDWKNSLHYVSC